MQNLTENNTKKEVRILTNEEGTGESPLLSAADNGERQPVGGDKGMQKRHRRNAADRRQIFGAESAVALHFPTKFFFLDYLICMY